MTLSEECAALAAEIQQLNAEHIASTGLDALHVGGCCRSDLHERLAGLHKRSSDVLAAYARAYAALSGSPHV